MWRDTCDREFFRERSGHIWNLTIGNFDLEKKIDFNYAWKWERCLYFDKFG
jgi:hypothetical protein